MLRLNEASLARRGRPLLHRINAEFRPGLLYGLLGPNGAGKSTLFKALTALWPLTSGTVTWSDRDLHTLPQRELSQILALMPQNPPCPFAFEVHELVGMGLYARGGYRGKHAISDSIDSALHSVNALHLRERSLQELSVGERQRVYLARCLATENPVLLLDEPTSSLDIRHQLEIWELLRRLVDGKRTIICAVHDIGLAERYCDEVAVLQNGVLQGLGSSDEILTPELLAGVFGVTREGRSKEPWRLSAPTVSS